MKYSSYREDVLKGVSMWDPEYLLEELKAVLLTFQIQNLCVYWCSLFRAAISTGAPQELLEHAVRDDLVRGPDLFSLRLSNSK